MINTNYWYYGQIRHLILCVLRIFQNFCVSEGTDENGDPILRRVPCVYMSTDKSVVYMLNNATDTILETVPKMVLAIESVDLNNNKISGAPYFETQVAVTEKKFNKDTGQYDYEPGNSYNITRLNPLPVGFKFKLYILTTMQDQKFQLFEQIRPLFSPTLELQTSENPLDWSRITAITLTGLNWSTKGTTNLDGSTLDAMDMTFEVDMNLDMPTLVQKQSIIEQINNSIGDGSTLEDIMSWSLEDVTRTYHSPTGNRIKVFIDEEKGKQKIKLLPSEKCSTWLDLFNVYGLHYDGKKRNININCLTNSNIDKRTDIIGNVLLCPKDPTILLWDIDESTLPSSNLKNVDEIINPHNYTPSTNIGTRYLIDTDISNCELWGTFIYEDGTPLSEKEKVNEGSIIELTNDGWMISLNPLIERGVYYIRDNSSPLHLYTYNNEYNMWVDVINKEYPVGFWRISERNI